MSYQYITIGCSHTNGTYLPDSDHWINILSKNRKNTHFFRISKNAAGLSFLVLYTKQYIKRGIVNPKDVKYVVIQKPKAYRHPFWGKDKTGYRYNKKITVRQGMHISSKEWDRLSKKKQKHTSEIIFQEQCGHLAELKTIFPNAQFAYYHYWGDYIAEFIYHPLLAEVNVQLGREAALMGMDDWGTIIDPKEIDGVYDKHGDLVVLSQKLFADGWVRTEKDMHPMKRHHIIVADKVEKWLTDHAA